MNIMAYNGYDAYDMTLVSYGFIGILIYIFCYCNPITITRVESIRSLQVGHFYNTQISWLKFADAGSKSSNQRPGGELMN